jgi:hypothetical protein
MTGNLYHKQNRSYSGSSLAELPPALFLLIFFAMFPVINLIMMGFTYCSCTLLNNLELREAARTPNSQLTTILASVQQNWQSSIMGQYVGLTIPPKVNVSYNVNGSETYVTVSTVFTAKSAINIPYFNNVPGLGAPWTYTIGGNSVLEDPSYANF